ncbi:MAG: hypothetical protein K2H73_06050, partial [Treponemataceae bacterium]|nr:hypothetical protein [Treponemataceae bacterium]
VSQSQFFLQAYQPARIFIVFSTPIFKSKKVSHPNLFNFVASRNVLLSSELPFLPQIAPQKQLLFWNSSQSIG